MVRTTGFSEDIITEPHEQVAWILKLQVDITLGNLPHADLQLANRQNHCSKKNKVSKKNSLGRLLVPTSKGDCYRDLRIALILQERCKAEEDWILNIQLQLPPRLLAFSPSRESQRTAFGTKLTA
jgi:hypothetical protein